MVLGAISAPRVGYEDGNTSIMLECSIEVGPRWMYTPRLEASVLLTLAPTRSDVMEVPW